MSLTKAELMAKVCVAREEFLLKFPLSPPEIAIVRESEEMIMESIANIINFQVGRYVAADIAKLVSIASSMALVAQSETRRLIEEEMKLRGEG